MSPTSISHYDIEEELGRGGMGIVYKAHDQRLNRVVALKVLPDTLSSDPEAKSRFLHEGRAASALDHSNICTIYEIGESEQGQLFIAMAYVEGRSLSDIVSEGPVKLTRALELAVRIGEGLAHSHSRGVVHRDLKPSNVMVSDADNVKILDFGLAKILGATQLTVSGTTLGTAAYMSPEQAQGQRVDHRTDIWSLGVLLYEMVTGVKPFQGEYQQALTYAIVNGTPEPLTGVRTGVPIDLDRIVFKALEKDPDDRYQHVEDVLVDLRQLIKSSQLQRDPSGVSRVSTPSGGVPAWIPWSIAALLAVAAIFFALRPNPEPRSDLAATIETEPLVLGAHPLAPVFAVDPSGRRLVYMRQTGPSSVLALRSFQSFTETTLEGTEGGHSPFFSPDGEWVGFMTDKKLKKVRLETGNVIAVADIPEVHHGGSWGRDGVIVIGLARELATVPASGGSLHVFARVDSAEAEDHFMVWPQVIPGSNYVLCTTLDASGGNAKIWAASRQDGRLTFVTEGGNARYLASGNLVFPRDGSLWIGDFDSGSLTFASGPVITLGGIMTEFAQEPSLALYDVSESGVLAFVGRQGTSGTTLLSWVDDEQSVERVSNRGGAYMGLHLDPAGRQLVTTLRNEEGEHKVQIFDIQREAWTTLPVENSNYWPHWGLDGRTIFMTHVITASTFGLASSRLGSVDYLTLLDDGFGYQVGSWIPGSPDLLLQKSPPNGSGDFDIVRFRPGAEPAPFINSPYLEVHPSVSPDGRWLAYASSLDEVEGGHEARFEVFVRGMESAEPRVQISQQGGWAPKWSVDGSRLFYETDAAIMVVDWMDPNELSPGKERPFFTGPFVGSLIYGLNYDVGMDGRLLVMLPEVETRDIRFVTGWLESVRP